MTQNRCYVSVKFLIIICAMAIKDKYSVKPIDNFMCKEWILKKHYAKRMPSVSYAFGLFDENNLMCGCCTFGQPPSDQIQMCCGEDYKENTIELNRLIKNDGLEKNLQSWFVARCFEYLPKPMIVISYSDPNTLLKCPSPQAHSQIFGENVSSSKRKSAAFGSVA